MHLCTTLEKLCWEAAQKPVTDCNQQLHTPYSLCETPAFGFSKSLYATTLHWHFQLPDG